MTRRQSIYGSLLLLWPVLAGGRQDPLAMIRSWMPVGVGDRWTYEEEIYSGDRKAPQVGRWQQQETTVAIEAIPQGVLVKRRVEFLNHTAPPGWLPPARRDESNILVHNGCIYYLNDSQTHASAYGRNNLGSDFDAEFLQRLASGQVLPDVCLPLRNGKTWGDPQQEGLWRVAGLGRRHADDPVSVRPGAWRIESNLASGDDNAMWFEQGVGLTGTRVYHNGTYYDDRVRLLRFEPGPGKSRR